MYIFLTIKIEGRIEADFTYISCMDRLLSKSLFFFSCFFFFYNFVNFNLYIFDREHNYIFKKKKNEKQKTQ
jgi:hypothetical protein